MKKLIIIGMAVVLFAVAAYTVGNYNSSQTKKNISEENDSNSDTPAPTDSFELEVNAVKEKAEDFTLTDLEGNEITLSDLKGKKVFLNFWATWCSPCKAEMPDIEKIYQDTTDSDLIIIAVNIGESKKTVNNFIEDKNYNFKVLLDSDQEVASRYYITAIPTSLFIDEDGYIIAQKSGSMEAEEMKAYIKKLDE